MKKILSVILTVTMIFSMSIGVFADNLVADGDALAPVASNELNLGNVAPGASITGKVLLAIKRDGAGQNTFANSATISVSYQGSNDTSLSATVIDASIKLPNNWISLPNSDMSTDTAYSTVTLTVPVNAGLGLHTATINYQASGLGQNGSTINRTSTLTVKYAVVKATPSVTDWPSANITYGQNLTSASFDGGTASFNGVSVPGKFSYSGLPTTLLDAGSYYYDTTFTPSDLTKYNTVTGKSNVTVNKADANIDVKGYNSVYDGEPHGATGAALGVNKEDLSSLLHIDGSFTNAPGGMAHWTFDGNNNYNPAKGSVAITISQANAAVQVSGYTGTYDGKAHGATGTATGVNGEDLSSLLDLGSQVTNASSGKINWSFIGNTNYASQQGSVEFDISKAKATINVTGYNGVYDGNPHGATGTAIGVNGEDLSSLLHITETYTDAPGGIAHWTFDGNDNYNAASGEVRINIQKASATIDVTGYNGEYDGKPHGATGTAIGVNGENLISLLDFGSLFTNVPGGTAEWSFTGNNNYNSVTGTVDITIRKAVAEVIVNGYTGEYDGNPHGAVVAKAVGVKGEDVSDSLNLGDTFTNVPGGTANWTFNGGTNYNDTSGSVNIVITKATPKVTAWPTATNIIYGQTLLASKLNGGIASVEGTFAFSPLSNPLTVGSNEVDVTFTPSDTNNYNTISGKITVHVNYKFSGILDPINTSGTTKSVFKAGSTIPVKFKLTDANNIAVSNATANIYFVRTDGSVPSAVNEAVSTSAATSGTLFRYDTSSQQYIYNLSTKGLLPGTYKITITLTNDKEYSVEVGLK